MASDQILKRAVFGGFKRECVIDYIEKLQLQQSETQKQADILQKKCRSLNKKADALADCQKRIDVLSSENESLKSEVERVSAQSTDSSVISDSEDIKSEISDTRQIRIEIEKLIKQLSESGDSESEESKLIAQLSTATDSLLKTLNRIDYGYDTDDSEDENQFRFDIDGLEKVENEFRNRIFIDE